MISRFCGDGPVYIAFGGGSTAFIVFLSEIQEILRDTRKQDRKVVPIPSFPLGWAG
jgi:hypothetical protein